MNSKPEAQISKIDTLKLLSAATLLVMAVAAFHYFSHYSTLARVIGLLAAAGAAVAIAITTELGGTVVEFVKDSRVELRKVVWPTRAETLQTSVAVIIMVIVTGIFLWILDILLFWIVRLLTGQG